MNAHAFCLVCKQASLEGATDDGWVGACSCGVLLQLLNDCTQLTVLLRQGSLPSETSCPVVPTSLVAPHVVYKALHCTPLQV